MVPFVLALLLSACGGGNASCAVPDGPYDALGSCFGMRMSVDLAIDPDTCAYTLDAWSMTHTGSPEGGTVDGDTVTLTGGDFVGCEGTVDEGTLSGVCADGCAWELIYAG